MWGPCECRRKRALTWSRSPAGSGPHACAGGPASPRPGLLACTNAPSHALRCAKPSDPRRTQELRSAQSCWPRPHQAGHANTGASSPRTGSRWPAGRQDPSLAHLPALGPSTVPGRVHGVQSRPREGCLEAPRHGASCAATGGGPRSPRPHSSL